MEEKKCSNCKRVLPITEFRKTFKKKGEYRSHCRQCGRFIDRKSKKGGTMATKEFGKWFISQKLECFYCGITPQEIEPIKNTHIIWGRCSILTLDRKDSSKGYNKGNLVLACMRCNRIKSNIFTYKEMKVIGKMLKNKNLGLTPRANPKV